MATRQPITRSRGILRQLLDRYGGTEQQDLSGVQNVLYASYQLRGSEVNRLQVIVEKRYFEAYGSEITRLIKAVKCTGNAQSPSGGQRAYLIDKANQDVTGAVENFNNGLKKEVQRLTAANPDATRQAYRVALDQWTSSRLGNVNSLIVAATRNQATAYANEQFKVNNQLTSERYYYGGRHPNGRLILETSSSECIRRVAAGIVNYDYVQDNPVPNHPRCPHKWELYSQPKVDCKGLWRG